MALLKFARVEVWSDYQCASGSRLAMVPGVVDVITTRDVSGDDSVQLIVPRNSPAEAELLARRVIRLVRSDGAGTESYDEWRIVERTRASGADANTYTYQARSPRADLVRGDVAQLLSTGEIAHVFSVTAMTPAQIIDTYVLPALAAAGLSYFARGTVDPTAPRDLSFEWFSPLSLLEALRDATATEMHVRRNGTTGYYIDLLDQLGAGATRPVFRQTKNLLRTEVFEQTQELVTRCIPRGGKLPGFAEYHTLARVLLKVMAVTPSGGTLILDVEDPAGSVQPIEFDDQFNNGWHVFRRLSGVTFPIVDTLKTGQQLVITSAANIAAAEYLELRSSDAQTARVGVPRIAPASGDCRLPYISAVDGALPYRCTVTDANGGVGTIDWITADGLYTDLTIVHCEQRLSAAGVTVDAANQHVNFGTSVANIAIGDLLYWLSNGASANPPHGSTPVSILWKITSIDVANQRVDGVQAYYANRAGDVLPNPGGPVRAVVIRQVQTRQIKTSAASANTIDLTASLDPTQIGRVILIEQRSGGVLPSYVDEPVAVQTPPTGYGIIPRPLDRPGLRGEGNLIRNPRGAAWTTPSAAPDGWSASSISAHSAEHSQNTSPAFVKYGAGRSWDVTLVDEARAIRTLIESPTFYVHPAGFTDLSRFCLKLSLFIAEFSGDAEIQINLVTQNAAGAAASRTALTLFSTDYAGVVPDEKVFSANQRLDLTIPALDINTLFTDAPRAGVGMKLQLLALPNVALGIARIYLDAVAAYQITHDPGMGAYVEGSYANQLLDAANRQLRTYAQPLSEYSLKIVDLERVTGDDPIVVGGELDLRDADLNVTATPRVIRTVVAERNPENTQLTLARRVERLTTQLAAGAA